MAESKMPARIWAWGGTASGWTPRKFINEIPAREYVRADIVERMAEALAGLVEVNENHNKSISEVIGSPVGWKDDYLDASRAALTSYRDATNDKA